MSDSTPKRITMQTISEYILTIFNLERGLLYTMQQLTIRPGQAIKEFLFTEKRDKHIKPFSFLILMATISTFITLKLMSQDINITGMSLSISENDSPLIQDLAANFNILLSKYFNLVQMLKIPFLTLGTYWLFKKNKFNFAEHLVINSFIFSYISFYIIFIGLSFLLFSKQVGGIVTILTFIYPIYVYIKLFEENIGMSILKSIGAYFIGNVLHLIFIGIIVFIMNQV